MCLKKLSNKVVVKKQGNKKFFFPQIILIFAVLQKEILLDFYKEIT